MRADSPIVAEAECENHGERAQSGPHSVAGEEIDHARDAQIDLILFQVSSGYFRGWRHLVDLLCFLFAGVVRDPPH